MGVNDAILNKMNLSALITGLIVILVGILVFFYSISFINKAFGLAIIVLGGFILFNEKEDKIEQVK
ncbi:MAG: hypothetical protein ACE5ES_02190 [Candidatus Nanoarchaeia archaeon]